jgi:tetratricopeptide (TPR) repeat protein
MFNIRRQEILQETDLINLIAEHSDVELPKCIFENRSLSDGEKWSIFEAIASAIAEALDDRLGVLVFDNLEYAHISLELLSYLIRNFRSRTLFVFLTNNEKATQKGHPCQEWLASLARSGGYETIKLQPLNQTELRSMLEGIFGHLEIVERDIEKIWKVSNGNPYYTSEIIRYLLNEGKISFQSSNWVCESIEDFVLPESLQQLAEIKLSQVSEDITELLRLAAVIGQQFTFNLLEKVSGLDEDEIIDSLEKAVKSRIIEETEKREEEYSFPDPTIRFVLYESIPRRKRRKLHLQVAQAIEALAGNSQQKLLRHSTALLHHYYEAGETEKTFSYGRTAAEAAFSQLDIAEAEKYYQWALTAATEMKEDGKNPDPAELAELYLGSAQIALHLGQIEKAEQALSQSEDLTKFHKNGAIVCRTQLIKSQIEYHLSNFETALESAEIGLSAAQSCGDAKLESGLLLMLAQILTALGKTEEALDSLECNLAISKQRKDHLTQSRILSLLGSTLGLIGNAKQGFTFVEEALKLAHSNKDRIGELHALLRLGQLYVQTLQLERALETYDCGLDLARILEAKLYEGMFENGRGDVYRYLGEMNLAQECYLKLMHISQSMDNPSGQALANHNLGLVTLELGIYYDAVKKIESALAEHIRLGQLRLAAEAYCALGYAREQIGQVDKAQQTYQTAIEYCQQITHPSYQWQAHYGLANIFWMFGQNQEALEQLTLAQEIIDHLCEALPEDVNLEDFMRDKLKVTALTSDIKQSLETE